MIDSIKRRVFSRFDELTPEQQQECSKVLGYANPGFFHVGVNFVFSHIIDILDKIEDVKDAE